MDKLTEKDIDGMLDSIQEALDDGNKLAADNLCLLTMVKLLADIDRQVDKSNRILMADLELSE